MTENKDYQMAIDLLRCHLGISEEEAKQQLGISTETEKTPPLTSPPGYFPIGLNQEK